MSSFKVQYSETCDWVNRVIKVLFEAWKNSAPFKRIVLSEIYIAINKGRSQFLSEV